MTPGTSVDVNVRPATIADAVVLHARLGALGDWVKARQAAVRGFVEDRALARMEEDGAAPTWRVDGGTALLTDPAPRPSIVDVEAFGRWYAREVAEHDPDRAGDVVTFGPVIRRTVASATSDALLDFLANIEDHGPDRAAATLADLVDVEDRWELSETLLDDLLDGRVGATLPDRPRLVVDPSALALIDTATGEVVPGTSVAPPGRRTVQIRPSTATKKAAASELIALVGPPALDGT